MSFSEIPILSWFWKSGLCTSSSSWTPATPLGWSLVVLRARPQFPLRCSRSTGTAGRAAIGCGILTFRGHSTSSLALHKVI